MRMIVCQKFHEAIHVYIYKNKKENWNVRLFRLFKQQEICS